MAVFRKYTPDDEAQLFELIKAEGEEWTYWQGSNWPKYVNCLANCVTYIAIEDGELCGYARCRNDDGFGVYVYDLLVAPHHRGKRYGHLMMSQAYKDFPDSIVYVMSDVDEYYQKQGYSREGSIFIVKPDYSKT